MTWCWQCLRLEFQPDAPPCPGDFNQSGGDEVQDIFDFLAAWFAGNLAADYNGASGIEVMLLTSQGSSDGRLPSDSQTTMDASLVVTVWHRPVGEAFLTSGPDWIELRADAAGVPHTRPRRTAVSTRLTDGR